MKKYMLIVYDGINENAYFYDDALEVGNVFKMYTKLISVVKLQLYIVVGEEYKILAWKCN